MRRFVWLGVGLIGLVGCGREATPPVAAPAHESPAHAADEPETVTLTEAQLKLAGIRTETVRRTPFAESLEVPGVVDLIPNRRALVTSPLPGRILELRVNVGDAVRRGDVLAILESVDLAEGAAAIQEAERMLSTASTDVERARTDLNLALRHQATAQTSLRRQRQLANTGAFAQPAIQAAERALNEARATLDSARREAIVHQAQLERSERLYKEKLISRVDLEDARLDVEKDRIAQERATRDIDIAQKAYDREREVARRGLLNAREVQLAESEAQAAELEVEKARIALRAAKTNAAGAAISRQNAQSTYAAQRGDGNLAAGGTVRILSPAGGQVMSRPVSTGQSVERASELFALGDPREVYVVAHVPEREIARIQVGAAVVARADAWPGQTFRGRIERVGTQIDPKTRALDVACRLPNPDGRLRPDMFVRVGLGGGQPVPTLTVPAGAVFEDSGHTYLFARRKSGEFVRLPIQIGRKTPDRIEVQQGVAPGEVVVVAGVFTLRSQLAKDELKGHED